MNRLSKEREYMTDRTEQPLLLKVEETALLLNVSRTRIYYLLRDGSLKSVKVGGRRLIPRQAIESFVLGLMDASQAP